MAESRVPLGVHRMTGRRYPFVAAGAAGRLMRVVSSVKVALAWLAQIERATVPAAHILPQSDPVGLPAQKNVLQKKRRIARSLTQR